MTTHDNNHPVNVPAMNKCISLLIPILNSHEEAQYNPTASPTDTDREDPFGTQALHDGLLCPLCIFEARFVTAKWFWERHHESIYIAVGM